MGYSLVSSLFPIFGEKEYLSESALGWAIGLHSVAWCIFTKIDPILCRKVSCIKLLSFGTFFSALITIIYGFLIYLSYKISLIIIIFSLRIFRGCCSSVSILVYSLIITFEKKEKFKILWAN